jgi:hypothetical protein
MYVYIRMYTYISPLVRPDHPESLHQLSTLRLPNLQIYINDL